MEEELEFQPFHKTYLLITFALIAGLIYPNPNTDRARLASMLLIIVSISPPAFLVLFDVYKSWLNNDVVNIIRHFTVIGPFLGGFLKMLLMYYKRVQAKQILDEINRDYLLFNDFSEQYKRMVRAAVTNCKIYSEKLWVATVGTCVMTFPVTAVSLTIYNALFKAEPTKYMIHDIVLPWGPPEDRFNSPYFEILFIYMLYCSVLYEINFTGFDGFFGLSINHACLKIQLYCKALEDAVEARGHDVCQRIAAVVREQCRLYSYVDVIQDTFNIWMGLLLVVASMIQACNCLYQITEGYGIDFRYMIFIAATVVHIYVPCRYATKLKALSLESADRIYCCGWEHVNDQRVKKMILIMLARAQTPIKLTAFNVMVFDMNLFVSILKTSYSLYTLLRS